MRRKLGLVICSMTLGLLSGCQGVNTIHKDTIRQSTSILKQDLATAKAQAKKANTPFVVPENVYRNLNPNVISHHQNQNNETVFDIKVKDMPIAQFMTALMQGLGYSVVVSPDLTQNVTLNLKNTTLEKTLMALHDLYGVQATRTSYGYKISPVGLETRIFTLNHINLQRSSTTDVSVSGTRLTSDTSDSSSNDDDDDDDKNARTLKLSSKTSTEKFWTTVQATLQGLVSRDKGGRVEVNEISGVIIVTAKPQTLKLVAAYLDHTQNIMDRQVVISAKILEIQLSKGFETGISWKNMGFEIDGSKGKYTFKSGLNIHNIDSVITMLQKEGKVTVLSSPRVVTMNNQQALIEVGTSQYFVTKLETGVTNTSATNTLQTNDVDLKPFFSGISLSVLPQINHTGDITLYIHPAITTVTEDKRQVKLSATDTLELPLAKSDVRETDSVVRVKSGQIIVLGGLMQNRADSDDSGLPGLAALGATTQNNDSGTVTELVILLQAEIPNKDTWVKQIKAFNNHYHGILQTYGVSH